MRDQEIATARDRAYQRALKDLRRQHPEDFERLYRERLAEVHLVARSEQDFLQARPSLKHRPDTSAVKIRDDGYRREQVYCVYCDKPWPCPTRRDNDARKARRARWRETQQRSGERK